MDENKKYVFVDGEKVYYREKGSGISILILAGWGGLVSSYNDIQDKLVEKHYRVILPDLPGLLGKTEPKKINLSEWKLWLCIFIDQVIGNNKFIIFSHSLGARIATEYLAKNDNRCIGAIFLTPGLIASYWGFFWWRLAGRIIPIMLRFLPPEMRWIKDKQARKTARQLISINKYQPKVPCFVIIGSEDPIRHFLHGWKELGCRHKQKKWGHSPQINNTKELADEVDNFIQRRLIK